MKTLLELRLEQKLTQEEMAKYLGISFSYYSKIENGTKPTSYNFLKKLKQRFPHLDMNIFLSVNNTNGVKKCKED